MDYMHLDTASLQPPRQPKPVSSGFECNRNARDRASGFGSLLPPTLQHPQQRSFVRFQFLERLARDPRHHARDQPVRQTQLDDRDERPFLFKGYEGFAQIVR
jgi:hypothetical protein